MPTGTRISVDGVECLYCHVVFGITEAHPASVEFINGYPSPCRHIGHRLFAYKTEDDLPWTKSHIKYDYVEIEREPLWMK